MKKLKFLLISVIMLFLASCAYNVEVAEDAYKALEKSATIYDQSMTVSASLYEQGIVSEFDKERIIESMEIFCIAHNASVDVLAAYGKYTDKEIGRLRIKLPGCYFEENK